MTGMGFWQVCLMSTRNLWNPLAGKLFYLWDYGATG